MNEKPKPSGLPTTRKQYPLIWRASVCQVTAIALKSHVARAQYL